MMMLDDDERTNGRQQAWAYVPRTTDTQWRQKSNISEKLGWCGSQNMLRPYLKIWDWDWIFGRAVKAISSLGVRSPCTYLCTMYICSMYLLTYFAKAHDSVWHKISPLLNHYELKCVTLPKTQLLFMKMHECRQTNTFMIFFKLKYIFSLIF